MFQTSGLLFLILWGLNGAFRSVFGNIAMRLLALTGAGGCLVRKGEHRLPENGKIKSV